ncbi:MAG TPA: efflux RND transporter periplasmic adaptor subunit [Flavilitoribacter sp.]|nr:efflux RND transporter periplasmic adaptor subunit [Flavilitoribacter sp.]
MKKRTVRTLSLILALVVFAGAFYIYQAKPFAKNAEPEASGPTGGNAQQGSFMGQGPTPVNAMVIKTGELRDVINVNGSTVPEEEVTVTSEVPGKITHILFKEGAQIQRGASLIQLDAEELQAEKERLLVRKELTQKIAERLKNLYDREGVSLQEYEIAQAEAEQVVAELDVINVQIGKRTIKAPFSGLLGLRQVSEGSYISPGTPVVSLVSINPIHIEFAVPEKYGNTLQTGKTIHFTIDGMNDDFQATVIAREPNIDAATRTLKLKASAPNPGGRILPGAFTNVTVNLQSFDDAILVPTEAIVPELGGKKVYVYHGGKADAVDVQTGIRKDAYIQVLQGLTPGDTLITTGLLQIRPGAPVTISEFQTAP